MSVRVSDGYPYKNRVMAYAQTAMHSPGNAAMSLLQFQPSAQPIRNELYIACPVERVYDYVTQPDRWHEWHPTSLSADTGMRGPVPVGQRFSEEIDLLGLQLHMDYRVLIARPPQEFKSLFTSSLADGCLHYRLQPKGRGTLFRRTLDYSLQVAVSGLHTRLVMLSDTAMQRLKARLEESSQQ